jgi:hypothetical protein
MKMQQWTVGILLFDQVDLTDITGPYGVAYRRASPGGTDGSGSREGD